jgi:hypothetical protein
MRWTNACSAASQHSRASSWSIAEVAELLERNPGATREYLSQCRKLLRPFLEPCRALLMEEA